MSAKYHYVCGAGQVGCLYDWGPECHETEEDALECVEWWADCDVCDDMPEALTSAEKSDMVRELRTCGIYYFPARCRPTYGDYVEISRQNGPCPDNDG